jgi:von Willebrand factor A domain-containing protein 5
MAGVPIKCVCDTLRLVLRALPSVSKFNIIGFGSTVDKLFAQSVKYTDAHVEIALEYVNQRVKADLGGTELLEPLRAALRAPLIDGFPRQVLLLTGTRSHMSLVALP